MRFRNFGLIVIVLLGLVPGPLAAEGQQPARIPRIGILTPGPVSSRLQLFGAFRQGLRDLGYVEGQNMAIDLRSAEGESNRLPELAAELVRLNVAVIVAATALGAQAAKQATPAIPIVMVAVSGDPVGSGLVASLGRPGGNITGLTLLSPELSGKRLQLLKESVPRVSRIAVLWNSANPTNAAQLEEIRMAARVLGVSLEPLEVRGPNDFERAFRGATGKRAGALLTVDDFLIFSHRTRIAELAAKSRLPAMFTFREQAEAGGLMSYGVNIPDLYRRAATYVDKILKGAKPADLPVEQPTRFELVINLKTAKALGLTIPPSVLIRATEVIQ